MVNISEKSDASRNPCSYLRFSASEMHRHCHMHPDRIAVQSEGVIAIVVGAATTVWPDEPVGDDVKPNAKCKALNLENHP